MYLRLSFSLSCLWPSVPQSLLDLCLLSPLESCGLGTSKVSRWPCGQLCPSPCKPMCLWPWVTGASPVLPIMHHHSQSPLALSSASPSLPTRTYELWLLAFSSTFYSIGPIYVLVSPPLRALKTQIGLPWTLHVLSFIIFSFIFVVLGIKFRIEVGHTGKSSITDLYFNY